MDKGLKSFGIVAAVALTIAAGPAIYRGLALGTPVEQNELSLVFRAIGDRTVETSNNFQSELITAARGPGPLEVGSIELKFPLGLQAYEFSGRQSFDSEANEAIVCDSRGGAVEFDVAVHLHIDETLPDIQERLVNFAGAYQLRSYDGSADVLSDLVQTRFRDIIREPFVNWCPSRSVITIMQNKSEINQIALDHMNDEFNQYGLRFTLVSVTSAMRVSDTQQNLLNNLVTQSTETAANDLRNRELRPLEREAGVIVNQGNIDAQAELDLATVDAAQIRATAEAADRTALIDLLGPEAFLFLETTIRPLEALAESDADITIVPEDARIYLGNAQMEE